VSEETMMREVCQWLGDLAKALDDFMREHAAGPHPDDWIVVQEPPTFHGFSVSQTLRLVPRDEDLTTRNGCRFWVLGDIRRALEVTP
jgi:hypothetical protein